MPIKIQWGKTAINQVSYITEHIYISTTYDNKSNMTIIKYLKCNGKTIYLFVHVNETK